MGLRRQAVCCLNVWVWMLLATQPGLSSGSTQWTQRRVRGRRDGGREGGRERERERGEESVYIPLFSADDEEEGLDLLEWYFILAYSVAGALVLAGVTVSVFACWLHRDQCWERVEQRKSTRMRVRRSKVNLGEWYSCVM